MTFFDLLLSFIPPIMLPTLRRLLASSALGRRIPCLHGDYPSWQSAQAYSSGYAHPAILERTHEAALKVKQGKAAYERDSVAFDAPAYHWPLIAALLRAASRNNGKLHVLDFGGGLGSSWFQHRRWLEHIPDLRWDIIEQPTVVEIGSRDFSDSRLRFFDSFDAYTTTEKPDFVLLSSVLQYLETPYRTLARIISLGSQDMLIDRTPISEKQADRLCVQHVPAHIYPACYPTWIFARGRLQEELRAGGYDIVTTVPALDHLPGPIRLRYEGWIMQLGPKMANSAGIT